MREEDKSTQEPQLGQPLELEVTDGAQAARRPRKGPRRRHHRPDRDAAGAPKEEEAPQAEAQEAPDPEYEEAERVVETIKQAIEEQAREDEKPHSTSLTFLQIIAGEMLQTNFMRKNVGMMILIAAFMVASITIRYSVQNMQVDISKLQVRLKDAKYRALSTGSRYTEMTRQSFVIDALRNSKDSVLGISEQPPYKIIVPKEGAPAE